MSRLPPLPPPPLTRSKDNTSSTTATMTETQAAPNWPPFFDYTHRRLPQPIQLPPLSIPTTSPKFEQHSAPLRSQILPAIRADAAPTQRSQLRPYSGPAAPLDKLLSPQSFTPPRSESALSSPSRTVAESRGHLGKGSQKYSSLEEPLKPIQVEQPYVSPIEPYRQSSVALPSPTFYGSGHSSSSSTFRPSVAPSRIRAPAPYSAPSYSELLPPPSQIISTTVSEGPRPEQIDLQYRLIVRQQPIAARACGFGERDRRVIDPPPIIQLEVYDPKSGTADLDELRYSLNVVHCTLWSADGTNEETALIQSDRRTTRRLMGQLVASPSVAKDEHDIEGCFFCFPDLSCRTNGRYRLRFMLMRIDPTNLFVGGFSPILAEVLSEVFTVYTAKDFPGMRPSSALTRALKLQGCNIQVKKGNEKALAARKRASISAEEGDLEAEDRDPHKAKRRRKEPNHVAVSIP